MAQAADQERDAEDEQAVGQDRADERRLDDDDEPRLQREDRDEQLREIPSPDCRIPVAAGDRRAPIWSVPSPTRLARSPSPTAVAAKVTTAGAPVRTRTNETTTATTAAMNSAMVRRPRMDSMGIGDAPDESVRQAVRGGVDEATNARDGVERAETVPPVGFRFPTSPRVPMKRAHNLAMIRGIAVRSVVLLSWRPFLSNRPQGAEQSRHPRDGRVPVLGPRCRRRRPAGPLRETPIGRSGRLLAGMRGKEEGAGMTVDDLPRRLAVPVTKLDGTDLAFEPQ